MQTLNLGYPRIGSRRELKKAEESFWAGKIQLEELLQVGKTIRTQNWKYQKEKGIDLIPTNDFSFYDQMLDTSLMVGCIPERFQALADKEKEPFPTLYFALARGYQKEGTDVTAMEMTKWFDTNYHYLVPEFHKDEPFHFFYTQIIDSFKEARAEGINAKPVLIGPVTYLILGKERGDGFDRLALLPRLLPVYKEVLDRLKKEGAEYIQIDEPCLVLDLSAEEVAAYKEAYAYFAKECPEQKLILTTYFGGLGNNLEWVSQLPVDTLHLDLVRDPQQLDEALEIIPSTLSLSLGVVDGRNIWKNDFNGSLALIQRAVDKIGSNRVWIGPSCSLLHSPCDLALEDNEKALPASIKRWMAFAAQKVEEIATLKKLAESDGKDATLNAILTQNSEDNADKVRSELIHDQAVKARMAAVKPADYERAAKFPERKRLQQERLHLPPVPTTTIGSFPQTKEVREARSSWRKGKISDAEYVEKMKGFIKDCVKIQEEIGLDVFVHGEFERNDMVEYFGEQLKGFAFTKNGWVQSYGSRCVKPPIIFGDVSRLHPMTVDWSVYSQSLTKKPMKGMLTGPNTILQWSFVRNDQPYSVTAEQIALAIRDEVADLEKAGIAVIQVDEPALREGLPLRRSEWKAYLDWAVKAFKLSVGCAKPETQIHTHMCYAEFNDIIEAIGALDADAITIEASRSQMDLLDAFINYKYPNDIGPGVYDIHSPRIPSVEEMETLFRKAMTLIPVQQLWINPDCGLKTRHWEETIAALKNMVQMAENIRKTL